MPIPTSMASVLVTFGPLYIFSLMIYRVYFHTLSHIPGPKIAAATYWYQSYYDLLPYRGKFIFQLKWLHDTYGPIVRIGPNEVSVRDASYYAEMYPAAGRRREKSTQWWWLIGWKPVPMPESSMDIAYDTIQIPMLTDLVLRHRRQALAPFFSRQKVRSLESRVRNNIESMKKRLLDRTRTSEPFDLYSAYGALTLDIITGYTLGESWGALDQPRWAADFTDALHDELKLHPLGRAFPLLMRTLMSIMMRLVPRAIEKAKFSDGILGLIKYIDSTVKRLYDENLDRGPTLQSHDARKNDNHDKTILQTILTDEDLPVSERSLGRLQAEANVLVSAGTDTTARTLAVAHYYVLSRPDIHSRLLSEIRAAETNPGEGTPSLATLEQLPDLSAVVYEALRLAHNVPGRLSRIAPTETLNYTSPSGQQTSIPAGTTFSQSEYLNHTDPSYFPDPEVFDPDRWLGPDAQQLHRYLVPFSKGSRACIGMHLAYAEIYIALASLIRDVEMELFETSEKDIKMEHEYLIPFPAKGSKGIRVKVLGPRTS